MESVVNLPVIRSAREVPEMLNPNSPAGLRIVQIAADNNVPTNHVYMEAHVFTPDSRRFIFQRLPSVTSSPRYYCICDIEDNCAIRQVTDEPGAAGAAVSPDGKWMYYYVNQLSAGQPGATLKRVSLENYERETLLVIDKPLSGTSAVPAIFYFLSSISRDGTRMCTSAFLGDGQTPDAPWGLLVFDLTRMTVNIVWEGQAYCNMHPQYCQAPGADHDIMIQENHGCRVEASGHRSTLIDGLGADIHVIRDDGTCFRDMPCGRDTGERCHGHQCWRGEKQSAIIGVDIRGEQGFARPLFEALPRSQPEELRHTGKNAPNIARNEITRNMPYSRFGHFAFDKTGTVFVGDYVPRGKTSDEVQIWAGCLPDEPQSVLRAKYLFDAQATYQGGQINHPHPFLSPDGRRIFFNSLYGGTPQIWMVEGFDVQEQVGKV